MSEQKDRMQVVVIGTGSANARALGGDGATPINDPMSQPPVIDGPCSRAWLCDLSEGRRRENIDAANDGTLAHWIVEAPWAHPCWHSYSVVLVHLRPMADGRKTLIYLDDATHEVWVVALNPDTDRRELVTSGIVHGHWLQPHNFAGQFIEITDELAQERVKDAVKQICDGKLSPDTDFISAWAKLFGDHMLKSRPDRQPPRER